MSNEKEYHDVPIKRPETLKEQIYSTNEWIRGLWKEGEWLLRPERVRLELCTLCQLDCAYCYMRTGNYGTMGKGYVIFDVFRDFVQKNNY